MLSSIRTVPQAPQATVPIQANRGQQKLYQRIEEIRQWKFWGGMVRKMERNNRGRCQNDAAKLYGQVTIF